MEINNILPVNEISDAAKPVSQVQSTQSENLKSQLSQQHTEKVFKENNPEKKEENIEEAVDKLNKTAQIFDRSLRFQVHEKTNRTMVSVVDTNSDKIIRQIPNEEVLDLVAKMDDYLGLIFDKKA